MVARVTGPTPAGGALTGDFPAPALADPIVGTHVRSRAEPVYNAKHPDFAVPGGGAADASAALATMEQLSVPAGATLFLPADTYRASLQPTKHGVTWRGAGMWSTIIIPVDALVGYIVQWGAFALDVTFEDMAFDMSSVPTGNVAFIAGLLAANVTFRRCRFFNVPVDAITANGVVGVTCIDCLWHSAGKAKGTALNIGYGTRRVRMLGDNRILFANGGLNASAQCEDIVIDGAYMDFGWWFGAAEGSGSGGTVTYTANSLTDTAAHFDAIATDLDGNYYARGMGIRAQNAGGTVSHGFATNTLTDTAAHFTGLGILKGEMIRCGGKVTRVSRVVDDTHIDHEGWVSDADRSDAPSPDNGDQYTIYRLYLGFIGSHTPTAVTVSQWHDMEGAIATPPPGTLYEIIRHPIYPVQVDGVFGGPVRKVRVQNSRIRGGWADNISLFSCEAHIVNNILEDGEDYGMTLDNTPAEVIANTIRHQGVVGIWAGGADSQVIANRVTGSTWTNGTDSYISSILVTGSGSNVNGNQLDGLGRPLSRYGICAFASGGTPLTDVHIGDNPSRGHAVSDLRLGSDGDSGSTMDLKLWGFEGSMSTDGTPGAVIPARNRSRMPVGFVGDGLRIEKSDGSTALGVSSGGLVTVDSLRHAGTTLALFGGSSATQAPDIPNTAGATLGQLETEVNKVKDQILRHYNLIAGPVPFDPTTIAGLDQWLKADALLLSDGDPIASWTDSSSHARNATQATGSARPTFRASVLNDKPVGRFDGGDSIKATWVMGNPFMVMLVARFSDISGFPSLFTGAGGNPTLLQCDGFNFKIYAGGGFVAGAGADTGFHIFVATFTGSASSCLRVDGGAGATGDPGSLLSGGIDFGATSLKGDIAEALVYSAALSLVNLDLLGNYLATKYGLTWTPAA